jgi:hypothetical protein
MKVKKILSSKKLKQAIKKDKLVKAVAKHRDKMLVDGSILKHGDPYSEGFLFTRKNPFKSGDRVMIVGLTFAKSGDSYPLPNEMALIGLVEITTGCAVKVLGNWYHVNQIEKHFGETVGFE